MSDVGKWLKREKLPEAVVEDFKDQEVDGIALRDLTDEDLKSDELPHVKLGHRKRILAKLKVLLESEMIPDAPGGDVTSMFKRLTCMAAPLAESAVEEEVYEAQMGDLSTLVTDEAMIKKFEEQKANQNESRVLQLEEKSCVKNVKDIYPRKFDSGHPKPSTQYKIGRRIREANTRPSNMLTPIEHYVGIDLTEATGLVLFARTLVQFVCACLNERTNGRLYFGVDKDGTVLGTKIDKEFSEYDKVVKKVINHCFFPDQVDIVVSCVRQPNFVEVINTNGEATFVCEIDVVPAADICKDEAFFVKTPREDVTDIKNIQVGKGALYRCTDGNIKVVEDVHISRFMEQKGGLYDLRKYRENVHMKELEFLSRGPSELGKKLITLLSLGNESVADLYPILVTNKIPHEMKVSLKENFSFICDIQWKAIFDFDSDATLLQYMEKEAEKVVKVIPSVSDFDKSSQKNLQNPDRLGNLHEEILSSVQPHWIFGNGYNVSSGFPQLSTTEWTREMREPFKEAVRFFGNEIPRGRAIIVFVVLSSEIEVLLEAMQEFLSVFRDQWVLITEEEEQIAEPIFSELTRRHCVEGRAELEARSVLGMPWIQIQETVKQVYGPKKTSVCQLPCSTGAWVSLKEKIQNELTDLEILSASECDNSELAKTDDRLKAFELEEESRFYSGGEASWWNYWLKTHVMRRNKHDEIFKNVKKTMAGYIPEDSFIGKVSIYHQPGAGGTTTAKQILWDYRKVYRCAIVRNITDQTASQIKRLRAFEDTKPQPVLLLMDNLDEEPTNVLLAALEEQSKHAARSATDTISYKHPFCVVLICFRRSKLPRNATQSCRTLIYHELDKNEIRWFQKKNEELERRNNSNENTGSECAINPKLLISFNIMRQNFDKNYIERITKEMVKEITDDRERKLLKHIAMLNAFDLRFREIPSAAFDTMMVDVLWAPGPRFGKGAEARCWETKLSPMFRVLINESSAMTFRSIRAFRITNPLLSKQVLRTLKQIEAMDETISAMALKFFGCKEIFNVSSHAKNELLKIIKDIMKHRGRLPTGQPETKFAPIIQHIIDKESTGCAIKVLEKTFELTNDPYIAQQLARINIFSENWNNATKFAEIATDMKPESSYLWDTYGRVNKNQVVEVFNMITNIPDKRLDVKETLDVIRIATSGAEIFRKVQQLSEQERRGLPTNNAGYFGELEIIECLLHCLNNAMCFKDKNELKQCIVNEDYYPEELQALVNTDEGAVLAKLKDIGMNTEKAMNKLEDERMQLRDETIDEYRINSIVQRNVKMEEIQANLDFYLGEDTDDLPPDMDPKSEEACRSRRRRMKSLGANSLRRIFDLKIQKDGEKKMAQINKLCFENINSGKALAIDYQMIISASLALAATDPKYLHSHHMKAITYDKIVQWSRKLYELRDVGNEIIYLEPYLFYVLFNWPRKTATFQVSVNVLRQALHHWREAYYRKWPSQREGAKPYKKKDTTIFFLAYGTDLASVINYHELKGPEYKRVANVGDGFWELPHVIRKLERFEGTLSQDGDMVELKMKSPSGNKDFIDIPTSFPIRDRSKWNKTVYFVIGFSWMGAKAFDIKLYDPTATDSDVQYMTSNSKVTFEHAEVMRREPITHAKIVTRLIEIEQKLKQIHDLKNDQAEGKRKLSKKEVNNFCFYTDCCNAKHFFMVYIWFMWEY